MRHWRLSAADHSDARFLRMMLIRIFPLIGIISTFFLPYFSGIGWRGQRVPAPQHSSYYDNDSGFCGRSVRLIKTFFFLSKIELTRTLTVPEIDAELRKRCMDKSACANQATAGFNITSFP
jgi:hypothetical protein